MFFFYDCEPWKISEVDIEYVKKKILICDKRDIIVDDVFEMVIERKITSRRSFKQNFHDTNKNCKFAYFFGAVPVRTYLLYVRLLQMSSWILLKALFLRLKFNCFGTNHLISYGIGINPMKWKKNKIPRKKRNRK